MNTKLLRTRQPVEGWAEFCSRIEKPTNWLRGADLRGANLRGTHLEGVIGNGREVKSIRLHEWAVVWFYSGNELTLAIGCQQHPLSVWLEATDEWLLGLHPESLAWRDKYGDTILSLAQSSPP